MNIGLNALHDRAMDILDAYGAVAMAFDSNSGPRNLCQGYHDCGQILTPFVCYMDTTRPYVVWNSNFNRPRFDFVKQINDMYQKQNR